MIALSPAVPAALLALGLLFGCLGLLLDRAVVKVGGLGALGFALALLWANPGGSAGVTTPGRNVAQVQAPSTTPAAGSVPTTKPTGKPKPVSTGPGSSSVFLFPTTGAGGGTATPTPTPN